MVIFGFIISKYVCLVIFGRKIKFANFQSLGPLLGTSHAKVKVITEVTYHSPGICTSSVPGGTGFRPTIFARRSGFELEKFSTV